MMNNIGRIVELIKSPRMFYAKPDHVNTCGGLFQLIVDYTQPDFVVAEIGSFAGVSTELFALHCKMVYSVDEYKPYPEINSQRLIEGEKRFVEMQRNYDNIVKVKKSSMEASKMFTDEQLDLVYIDASHAYHDVKTDIELWLPKVKSGGCIAGHDYHADLSGIATLDGPRKAVVELLGDEIITFEDTSWLFKKS